MPVNKGWFRFYDRMIDSPQVLGLNDSECRLLVSLCLSSSENKSGKIEFKIQAIRRRTMPEKEAAEISKMLKHLQELNLLEGEDGNFSIPKWQIHQYGWESKTPEGRARRGEWGKRAGDKAYAFWFKLLEILGGGTENHYFDYEGTEKY
jgi:hypothetical protein